MALPADVRRFFGFALPLAQAGEKCDAAMVLKRIAKMKSRLIDNVEVFRGSDNVFADLGLTDAEKLKIKTGLVIVMRLKHKAATCWKKLMTRSTVSLAG
jgi:hypothetical protein